MKAASYGTFGLWLGNIESSRLPKRWSPPASLALGEVGDLGDVVCLGELEELGRAVRELIFGR